MSIMVNFSCNGDPLFVALVDTVPRVGETVSLEFVPGDRPEWNQEALDHGDKIHNWDWVVRSVYHSFRKSSVGEPPRHSIFIDVGPRRAPRKH